MFDKILFDRNAFDRSVSSEEGLALITVGSGQVAFHFIVKTPIIGNIIGNGTLNPNIHMQQQIQKSFDGTGNINNIEMILKRSFSSQLNGQGAVIPDIVIKTPISAAFNGEGTFSINSQMYLTQRMLGTLSGSGIFVPNPIFSIFIDAILQGSGRMSSQIRLQLPLDISNEGEGSISLRRIGELNENIIALLDINLLPGETLTIDTDLLQVLFGATEDVSSITSDSVFFELNPGENEISIDIDNESTMDVVAIWQNRWL